jgi:Mce-associated membrane protein
MAADADTPDGELSQTTSSSSSSEDASEESPQPAVAKDRNDVAEDNDDAADDDESEDAAGTKRSISRVRLATVVGLVSVVALMGLVGWLGFRAYQSHQTEDQRRLFLQAGRQGALNLTTIDWEHADNDVQRILDSATGTFYDDFSKRQQPFIEVVKKAQSKSVGTITDAGLESESRDEAQVLVAVSVKTSNLGAADQAPRAWRMRMSVTKVGDDAKISNVQFVP